ncbi:unnamed protein product [Echinostoma caproni]|uniref:Armadillo repeat-containing protein 3 n=1 Tax=Echinostoma caproni TaxID=27848 RepID=A0A183ARM3_9TREM|nr:unnamed protein product [Echinostoma caproni]
MKKAKIGLDMTTGKKTKKDEQSSSETFDPVTVGLHQADSAILLLNSPEDDVKIRAAEALYKFAIKSEENKKYIFGQNVCDTLIQLFKSEDKIVKRNAMMVLGVVSEIQIARTSLLKKAGFVALLIKMLQQDEFDTTKEFALMTLSHMCLEFQGIFSIVEKKGLGPIAECLKHTDPDVQKNTLEVLCATLQDFEARPLLRSNEILASLMDLLNSEYPVIQDLTLQTFARATLDSTIRTALREMDALNHFVNIIGNSQCNDIHVPALVVIANLLEDTECAKNLINSGGLKMLLHFITDRNVFREEELRPPSAAMSVQDKAGKGKKPQERKSAKKIKGDATARKGEEKPASNTLPEAKIQACRAVMQAARKEEIRKIMHDADVERMLVALLSHEDEGVRSSAAHAIAVLAESSVSQNSISDLGGLELLIRMTRSVHKLPKSAGITALAALTNQNSAICREVANRNSGTEALISCLQVSDPEIEAITVGGLTAITNLALEEATRPKMLQAVSSKLLALLLLSNSTLTQAKAAVAIAAVVCNAKSVNQFCRQGGAENLIKLLHSPVAEVRRASCWAIYTIGTHNEAAKCLAQAGGIQVLQEINSSLTKRNAFSELALQRVFDANLEAKFVLTGYLDYADIIRDQFFDPGQLLSASEILNLEDYLKQPLNDRRPIYLINIRDA